MVEELYHHGIKGQKWGVRRFQNPDGTLTDASRKRYSDDSAKEGNSGVGKKVVKAAVLTGAVAAAAYAYSQNFDLVNDLVNSMGRVVLNDLEDYGTKAAKKAGVTLKKAAVNTAKKAGFAVKKRAVDAGNKMIDAALISIGSVAISKLAKKIDENENLTDEQKKVLKDIGSSGISSITSKNQKLSNSSTDRDLLVKTRNLQDVVGNPKGMMGEKDEKAYQALFKNNPTDDQRAVIKAMRKNGYSPDQIEQYVFHSGINDKELLEILVHIM